MSESGGGMFLIMFVLRLMQQKACVESEKYFLSQNGLHHNTSEA